ncbi:MAG TPA: hypothetical protein VKB88_27645 [Bryobacteraceae bacterium]|nr:hypothetical protein [Bryobacteraceae bacterium]
MNHWMWAVSLVGILSTAVVCGTDMFFLTVGRPALRLASSSAGTEVMGFFHMFGDVRMPIWGVAAILCNLLLALLSRGEQRRFYFASLVMLILFVIAYGLMVACQNRLIRFKPKRRRPGRASRMVESCKRRGIDR